jgi:hypothetical protein
MITVWTEVTPKIEDQENYQSVPKRQNLDLDVCLIKSPRPRPRRNMYITGHIKFPITKEAFWWWVQLQNSFSMHSIQIEHFHGKESTIVMD